MSNLRFPSLALFCNLNYTAPQRKLLRIYNNPAQLRFFRGPYESRPSSQLRRRRCAGLAARSEEHTSELQSLMRHSYAVSCLKKHKLKKVRSQQSKKTTETDHEQ